MKNLNPFLTIGLVGLFITASIHMLLYMLEDVKFSYMSTFYMVWIVFFVIGIAKKAKKNIGVEHK